jgi:hypothetical protein
LTDETGSGANVFATSPTLVTPLLGTPTSGVATNLTGLPLTTGVTGTLPTANGGTNLGGATPFTSGGVVYASSSSALATGSALQFTGTSLLVGTTSATANFNILATQATDAPAGMMVENTSNTVSASAVMRYKSSGSIFAYTGLGSPIRSAYAGLGANILSMYTGGDAGISLVVDNAAGPITFNTNSAEAMRISPAGNVGIGTSSPAFLTEIVGGATTVETTLLQIRSNAGGLNTGSTISFANSTNSAAGSGRVELAAIRDTASGCSFVIRTADSVGVIQNRVKISETGQFAIGTTTSVSGNTNLKFVVKSSGSSDACEVQATTNGAFGFDFRNASGTQVGTIAINSATTTYNTSSDYRLKNTIAPMTGALAKVALLKPCTYKWNADGSDGEGFIAHELAEVCPYAVTGAKDALDANGNIKPQGIDVSFLVATLTSAIQELKAEFDAYKASHP